MRPEIAKLIAYFVLYSKALLNPFGMEKVAYFCDESSKSNEWKNPSLLYHQNTQTLWKQVVEFWVLKENSKLPSGTHTNAEDTLYLLMQSSFTCPFNSPSLPPSPIFFLPPPITSLRSSIHPFIVKQSTRQFSYLGRGEGNSSAPAANGEKEMPKRWLKRNKRRIEENRNRRNFLSTP
ncbi:hypothetical protein DMENIID0001_039420 [Sergentomyia squamirostris]